ncbi:MAG TPA: hypothetical protein VFZ26_04390, partial [Gemmatimonadales bacterium]
GPAVHRGTAWLGLADGDLARVVGLLLRHAGFAVERRGGTAALGAAASRPDVSLVVLAGGSGAAGAHPLGGFCPPEQRGYRVVALVSGDPAAARAAGADHVVQLPFDPGTFTTDIIEAADRR